MNQVCQVSGDIMSNSSRRFPILLDHMTIQPTWGCERDCRSCYLMKERNKSLRGQRGINWFRAIFREILFNKSTFFRTKQVTLSVDRVNTNELANDIVREYIRIQSSNPDDPEKCITVHNKFDIPNELGDIKWISVSHISNYAEAKQLKNLGKLINWNVRPQDITKDYLEANRIADCVDHIHLLLTKPVLGVSFSRSNFTCLERAYAGLDICTRNKLTLDRCYQTSQAKGNFGCNANLKQIAIWPDGTVTGCPYNSSHEDLQYEDSLVTALRDEYDWDKCKIKEIRP